MRFLKIIPVLIVALVITTLGIDAADTLSGKGGTMLGQLMWSQNNICPSGMVEVAVALTFSCVDEYEASPDDGCAVLVPKNPVDTEVNINKNNCQSISNQNREPWRYINREQAAVMCARSGKRLPSAAEWYQFALGTNAENCNTSEGEVSAGNKFVDCVSAVRVKNTVGNVWEWVSDDVIGGKYNQRDLPVTGYVLQVDSGGVATVTALEKDSEISGEYFWSNQTGAFAIIRGGYYGSKTDAGVFTVHAQTLPTFTGNAVGFRCVR
ncbi:MAG TPA: SUMF1/EgtB/PvdO family nonheme iron enzyme [Candidatus Paceibacterota bacterium]|nr:SUMF1/EgtB/PvdO family nonheme iron enzyme [Candidatus Paceibacterota bacterium]